MAQQRVRDVEPPRKPRAGWAEAAKPLREEQDGELREKSSLVATSDSLREAKYLAVDVDVRSRRSLAPLLAAWPNAETPGRVNQRAPRWLVLSGLTAPKARFRMRDTADFRVNELVRVVEDLPRPARRCWNEATHRTFDIAIEGPPGPCRGTGIPVSQRTIEAVARVGGRIVITVYPPEPD
jgi:hypothetical protein